MKNERSETALPESKGQGPKVLLLDIETSPLQSYHWGLWQQNISLAQIGLEWSVLSFAAKWLHAPKKSTVFMDTFDEDDNRNDMTLLAKLWELLDAADFVVAQNGKRFDMKKINARMVMHGFPPYSPVRVIDTLLIAKAAFGFTSNKLEWMADKLSSTKKRAHKKFPGFELWVQFLARNPAARKEMRLYNIDDILSLEEVYLAVRPWAIGHPNLAAMYPDDGQTRCPKCASSSLEKRGFAFTNTGKYHRFCCKDCGGWSRSRYTVNTKEQRFKLLSN
jgi:hypothetical protein